MRAAVLILILAFPCFRMCLAQSPTGTISGIVVDASEGSIPNADVVLVNDATGIQYAAKTNAEGIYVVTNLPPGPYRIQVSKVGFKTLIKPDITLAVQDAVAINFTLPIGAISEVVTIEAGAPLVNTESAAVSTVVDRQFVENMPLNGRSFQTLIALTPGVVLTHATSAEQGQFSVNGQRADANYFMVDGVSANFGISAGSGLTQTAGGALPGFSALGSTNTLVSVDALQEFRIQTSSFAPEFGGTPGGQVSLVTRSGGSQFHGSLFDYFRNDVLDANDWFADRAGLPKAPERQNDFGGTFSGPIVKNKSFFFFSYEGLRLRQPLTQETLVPDNAARQSAPAGIQPILKAFPIQNGAEVGGSLAQFNASYSNPSTLDAYSIRIDHVFGPKWSLFGRYNYAPSQTSGRVGGTLSDVLELPADTQTMTVGLLGTFTPRVANELRANYSNYRVGSSYFLDDFGGAMPPPSSVLFPTGVSASDGIFFFDVIGAFALLEGKNSINEQRQVNVLDNVSVTAGAHQVKFGTNYRWLAPFSGPLSYEQFAGFFGMTGPSGVLSGRAAFALISANQPNQLLVQNLSFYGQDTWRITGRLTLTYGLRWDIDPPLKGKHASSEPYTVTGLNDPANLELAPRGTPLFETTYGNIAPRVGAAYQLRQTKSLETILRAGFGKFYDLGGGSLGLVTQGFPYTASNVLIGVPFPLSPSQAAAPAFSLEPPVSALYVTDRNLKLPYAYQWNVAVEQSLGTNQALSFTYIGSSGRNLLRPYYLGSPNADFESVFVTSNTGTSDYSALQIKYQRRLSGGLQILSSYTFSHSIDNSSADSAVFTSPSVASANVDRASSDFDVRNSFTAALLYNIPEPGRNKFARSILGNWSVDTFVFARTALPVNIYGGVSVVPGVESQVRPDLVPDQPLYLFGSQYPGGKAFSAAAFVPAAADVQGDFGRNVLRGFGAWQADFAVFRQFHIKEGLNLQFRSEFFNLFNHPNFGDPTSDNRFITSTLFGQSTESLASSLGSGGPSGGFNPLYQIGGPRSIQLALKLQF